MQFGAQASRFRILAWGFTTCRFVCMMVRRWLCVAPMLVDDDKDDFGSLLFFYVFRSMTIDSSVLLFSMVMRMMVIRQVVAQCI